MSYRIKTTWDLAVKLLWEDRLYDINFVVVLVFWPLSDTGPSHIQ